MVCNNRGLAPRSHAGSSFLSEITGSSLPPTEYTQKRLDRHNPRSLFSRSVRQLAALFEIQLLRGWIRNQKAVHFSTTRS